MDTKDQHGHQGSTRIQYESRLPVITIPSSRHHDPVFPNHVYTSSDSTFPPYPSPSRPVPFLPSPLFLPLPSPLRSILSTHLSRLPSSTPFLALLLPSPPTPPFFHPLPHLYHFRDLYPLQVALRRQLLNGNAEKVVIAASSFSSVSSMAVATGGNRYWWQ